MMRRCGTFARGALRGASRAGVASLLAGAALFFSSALAEAHAIGLSSGEYRATRDGLDVTLVFARAEAMAALATSEAQSAGATREPRRALEAKLARDTIDKVRVTTVDGACTASLTSASHTEQDGFEIRGSFRCPSSDATLTVALPLLDDLSHGHRHAAHVVAGGVESDYLLHRSQPSFAIDRAGAASGATPASASPGSPTTSSTSASWGGFVRMGIEHILSGYDHLLFLLALVLAGGTIRSLALAVTSFTVAHSVTLGLAVLGFVAPPARWIEPAIALSVAYVGLENFFPRRLARPWITFPFGFVHGFGFAGALGEVAIPRSEVPRALLSFNLGVELGQLAWMIALGLLAAHLRRWPWFGRRAVPALSAMIVAIGLVWFVGRLRDPALALGDVACSGVVPSQRGVLCAWCG